MEAEKLRKKLNGSILKGKKFKVEVARPLKESKRGDKGNHGNEATPPTKKRKTENSQLEGYELPSGREVKRGWTESPGEKKERRKTEKQKKDKGAKQAKSQPSSKYSENAECLFRTKLPPNRVSNSVADGGDGKKAKKKKKAPRDSVVHEFANTVAYPSFLRSEGDGSKPAATFEEGRGWLNDSGDVVEPVNDQIRSDKHIPGAVPGSREKRKSVKLNSREEDDDVKGQQHRNTEDPSGSKGTSENIASDPDDWTSSSGSDSEDSEDSEDDEGVENSADDSADSESEDDTSSSSSGSSDLSEQEKITTSATINTSDPPEAAQSPAKETPVHPLEALYKRPDSKSSESKRPVPPPLQFSFFGGDDNDNPDIEEDESGHLHDEPLTPFTKADMQLRGQRSAAPTPETAVATRFKWNDHSDESSNEGGIDGDGYDDVEVEDTTPSKDKKESEFVKWFWEFRGENNRAWKRRRREAAKEHRQKENRRKGMKGKS